MEEREQLSRALRKIFWGYIFLYFDFNIGTLDILPTAISFFLFYQAIRDCLEREDEATKLLKSICVILGVYHLIDEFMVMFQIPVELFLVEEIMAVLALYFHFQFLTNLANIADKYSYLAVDTILALRTVYTVMMTILTFTMHFEEIEWLSLMIMVAQVFITIFICFVIGKFRRYIDAIE